MRRLRGNLLSTIWMSYLRNFKKCGGFKRDLGQKVAWKWCVTSRA